MLARSPADGLERVLARVEAGQIAVRVADDSRNGTGRGRLGRGRGGVGSQENGGLARATIGWPMYPAHTPSTLDFTAKARGDYWFQPRWPEPCFPEAFLGTIGELLQ